MLACIQTMAQEQFIYADTVTIGPRGEAEVAVNMDFDTEPYEKVGLCFFLIHLPEGIEQTNAENPAKSCTLSTELVGELDESLTEKVFHAYNNYGGKGSVLIYLDANKGSFTLKGSHGELLRMKVRSALSESLTFAPEITFVNIADGEGIPLVTDGVRVKRPDYNTLYINDMEACTGDELSISVKMRNKVPCESFSFILFIPPGSSFVTDDEGNLLAALSEERTTPRATDTFEVVVLNDQMIRVLAASSNGTPFSGNDGEVFTVRIRIGDNMKEGRHTVQLMNISVGDVNAVSYDMDMSISYIDVSNAHRGDANGDGSVTVADMTAIAHYILGHTPSNFSEESADANRDGKINVADYTAVAHLLLYGKIEGPATAATRPSSLSSPSTPSDNTLYIDDLRIPSGSEFTLSVKMKNTVDAEGFQFTLSLPEGVSVVRDANGFAEASLSTERTTKSRTNTFATSLLADGTLKVFGASTNGSAIAAGDGEVCTVRVRVAESMKAGDYEILLNDVAISDTNAQSHDVEQVKTALTVYDVSGINGIGRETMTNNSYYDLQGRSIGNSQPKKGLYIHEGKKYVR
jgi:hypothetical protein